MSSCNAITLPRIECDAEWNVLVDIYNEVKLNNNKHENTQKLLKVLETIQQDIALFQPEIYRKVIETVRYYDGINQSVEDWVGNYFILSEEYDHYDESKTMKNYLSHYRISSSYQSTFREWLSRNNINTILI